MKVKAGRGQIMQSWRHFFGDENVVVENQAAKWGGGCKINYGE